MKDLMGDKERMCAKYGLEHDAVEEATQKNIKFKPGSDLAAKFKYAFKDKTKDTSRSCLLGRCLGAFLQQRTERNQQWGPSSGLQTWTQPLYHDLYLGATSKFHIVEQDEQDPIRAGVVHVPQDSSLPAVNCYEHPFSTVSDYVRDYRFCRSRARKVHAFTNGTAI
ncbi:hypothetical protein AJ80_08922 [Polytolypa hystricis UAMH7299]|uniref:Uncharacterized protein n=1 Tax=Polytolypa hystricis (strain UAMH7299) TaxID=1447883 RepID=A0A2B7X028_POLH7|nr:hypothetical protein AJ80_08922 [Polytolypa hystricis UAMH7299]